MEVKDFICMQFDNVKRSIERVVNGLKQEEFSWRPASGCNSIGLILFHIARTDDGFLAGRILGRQPVWEADKWHERLNLSPEEEGAHYTADQVDCLTVPPIADLMAYADAARRHVVTHIKTMSPDQLEQKVDTPFAGAVPVANLLGMMLGHASQHVGEMSYLRGLQRGMDK